MPETKTETKPTPLNATDIKAKLESAHDFILKKITPISQKIKNGLGKNITKEIESAAKECQTTYETISLLPESKEKNFICDNILAFYIDAQPFVTLRTRVTTLIELFIRTDYYKANLAVALKAFLLSGETPEPSWKEKLASQFNYLDIHDSLCSLYSKIIIEYPKYGEVFSLIDLNTLLIFMIDNSHVLDRNDPRLRETEFAIPVENLYSPSVYSNYQTFLINFKAKITFLLQEMKNTIESKQEYKSTPIPIHNKNAFLKRMTTHALIDSVNEQTTVIKHAIDVAPLDDLAYLFCLRIALLIRYMQHHNTPAETINELLSHLKKSFSCKLSDEQISFINQFFGMQIQEDYLNDYILLSKATIEVLDKNLIYSDQLDFLLLRQIHNHEEIHNLQHRKIIKQSLQSLQKKYLNTNDNKNTYVYYSADTLSVAKKMAKSNVFNTSDIAILCRCAIKQIYSPYEYVDTALEIAELMPRDNNFFMVMKECLDNLERAENGETKSCLENTRTKEMLALAKELNERSKQLKKQGLGHLEKNLSNHIFMLFKIHNVDAEGLDSDFLDSTKYLNRYVMQASSGLIFFRENKVALTQEILPQKKMIEQKPIYTSTLPTEIREKILSFVLPGNLQSMRTLFKMTSAESKNKNPDFDGMISDAIEISRRYRGQGISKQISSNLTTNYTQILLLHLKQSVPETHFRILFCHEIHQFCKQSKLKLPNYFETEALVKRAKERSDLLKEQLVQMILKAAKGISILEKEQIHFYFKLANLIAKRYPDADFTKIPELLSKPVSELLNAEIEKYIKLVDSDAEVTTQEKPLPESKQEKPKDRRPAKLRIRDNGVDYLIEITDEMLSDVLKKITLPKLEMFDATTPGAKRLRAS